MPYIQISTNVSAPDCRESYLHKQLDDAMTLLPGIQSGWTMTNFRTNCCLWFGGTDAPAAIAEVFVYGDILATGCDLLTERITEILSNTLEIEVNRIYVKYTAAECWGCSGENYD